MSENNSGMWVLVFFCCTPYLAGIASTLLVAGRLAKHGLWGLLPFCGIFKRYWEERQG